MGTRDAIRAAATTSKDHPHAYGDKFAPTNIIQRGVGSSPRVWGQGQLTKGYLLWYKDHPHAYGDKGTKISEMTADQGSSPRVWGQVCHYGSGGFLLGIIPTRMGTSRRQIYFHHQLPGSSPRVWGQGTI